MQEQEEKEEQKEPRQQQEPPSPRMDERKQKGNIHLVIRPLYYVIHYFAHFTSTETNASNGNSKLSHLIFMILESSTYGIHSLAVNGEELWELWVMNRHMFHLQKSDSCCPRE